MLARRVPLLAVAIGVSGCHAGGARETTSEVDRALVRVVPGSARTVSPTSHDRRRLSVSASREFETDMTWGEYVRLAESALAPDWRLADDPDDAGPGARHFSKAVPGDAYFLSVERVNPSTPLRVRVVVLGVPD